MARIHSLPDIWRAVSIAPTDRDLEVCIHDKGTHHKLIFPCRWNGGDWVDASTRAWVDIEPTHWRLWSEDRPTGC
jgi:hypothetical protein